MRILVTNDDGVASAGLAVLAQAALDRGHRVKVAAPAEEYSGASASLSGEEIDGKITARLAEGWKLDRLDRSMRAILRSGTYELIARPDVTVGTVIDEYLDIAHAFFGEKDVKFVNGLLDKVAGDVRA